MKSSKPVFASEERLLLSFEPQPVTVKATRVAKNSAWLTDMKRSPIVKTNEMNCSPYDADIGNELISFKILSKYS